MTERQRGRALSLASARRCSESRAEQFGDFFVVEVGSFLTSNIDEPPLLQDKDHVASLEGGEAVRDHEAGAPLH